MNDTSLAGHSKARAALHRRYFWMLPREVKAGRLDLRRPLCRSSLIAFVTLEAEQSSLWTFKPSGSRCVSHLAPPRSCSSSHCRLPGGLPPAMVPPAHSSRQPSLFRSSFLPLFSATTFLSCLARSPLPDASSSVSSAIRSPSRLRVSSSG